MMWAKGFAAEETEAAFSHAMGITAKTDNFEERFATRHFQWTLAYLRGELRSARELELSFLKEAEDTGRAVEAGVARRGLALACYQAGDFPRGADLLRAGARGLRTWARPRDTGTLPRCHWPHSDVRPRRDHVAIG